MLSFVSLAHASNIVAVPSAEARQWANTKGNELLQALSEKDAIVKYNKLDKMMTEDVNLNYIGKFVIGKYGKKMTAEQKDKYDNLFRRYVLSLYRMANFNFDVSSISFSIDSVTEYPKFTNILCTINPGNLAEGVATERIPVKFKLIRGENNRIQAIDVDISSVSMVIEYRKRFYQMILEEEENMAWFLEKFEEQVKANEDSFNQESSL